MSERKIARLPGTAALESEIIPNDAPDATPGKLMASLNFYERPDMTMAIEGLHLGEFDQNIQQHRLLEVIMQFLPQIVDPANLHEQTHQVSEAAQ